MEKISAGELHKPSYKQKGQAWDFFPQAFGELPLDVQRNKEIAENVLTDMLGPYYKGYWMWKNKTGVNFNISNQMKLIKFLDEWNTMINKNYINEN